MQERPTEPHCETRAPKIRSVGRQLSRVATGAGLLWLAVIGCTSGLGKLDTTAVVISVPTDNVNQGFDLGGSTRQTIPDVDIAAAQIPLDGTPGTQEYIFVAFTSEADPANLFDISGLPGLGVADGNGSSDVFVVAIRKSVINGQPSAFNQGLMDTFQHPRCIRCHGFRSPTQPTFSGFGSSGSGTHLGGPNSNCLDCHNGSTTGLDPSGDAVVWEAPTGLDFRDEDGSFKSAADLVTMLEDFESEPGQTLTASQHLQTDDKIIWAIERGTVPQDGALASGGVVPISLATWTAQINAWEAGGRQVNTADAIQVAAYASLNTSLLPAGGASQPSITFVPDPGYDPSNPGLAPAGNLFVAYVTDAANMVGSPTTGIANVIVQQLEVSIDAAGDITVNAVNTPDLASAPDGTTTGGGNGDSTRPRISADGTSVVFQSVATNLIGGFTDGNGAAGSDIFVRNLNTNATTLASRSTAAATTGGDGSATRPALAPSGNYAAFESDATDHVSGDDNGLKDVFLASLSPTVSIDRISQRNDGSSASGGASDRASIFDDGSGVLVAFESNATDLTGEPRYPGTNVYLYDSAATETPVVLISRQLGPAGNAAANGSSFQPRLSDNGTAVYFETLASNLDTVHTTDGNQAADIVRADITNLPDRLTIERVSITGSGIDSNGDSINAYPRRFERADGASSNELVLFETTATNLGTPLSTDLVIALIDANSNPTPSIATSPDRPIGLIGELFTFDATSSTEPDANDEIASYEWDFGDATSATGDVVTKAFASAANFTVTLTTADTRGGSAETTFGLRVNASNTAPTCDPGTYGPASALSTVTIDGSGSSDPDTGDTIVSYEWDLGDGTTATGASFGHAYSTPNTYTIMLTVTDYFGATSTCSTTIDIIAVDPADITFTAVYNDILSPSCGSVGCHDPLYFDVSFASPSDAYTMGNLFGTSGTACYTGYDYVVPSNPDLSLLTIKTSATLLMSTFGGGCGTSVMPSPGSPLSSADYLRLRLWIESGAPNN